MTELTIEEVSKALNEVWRDIKDEGRRHNAVTKDEVSSWIVATRMENSIVENDHHIGFPKVKKFLNQLVENGQATRIFRPRLLGGGGYMYKPVERNEQRHV